MSVENFLYFMLGSATFFTVAIASAVRHEQITDEDRSTQTDNEEEEYEDFPGVEEIKEKYTKKSCFVM